MNYDAEKHRRKSIRLKGWDYSSPGNYFVTICSRGRECIFSVIKGFVGVGLAPTPRENVQVELTRIGDIVEKNLKAIGNNFSNVHVNQFVIMPNHVHLIVKISRLHKGITIGIKPTLGDIIGSFKSKCSKENLNYIDKNNLNEIGKLWQRNYHDEILRTNREIVYRKRYMENNSADWLQDENNPINFNKSKIGKHEKG